MLEVQEDYKINTGLGLKLWQKEEQSFNEIPEDIKEKVTDADLKVIVAELDVCKTKGDVSLLAGRWAKYKEVESFKASVKAFHGKLPSKIEKNEA